MKLTMFVLAFVAVASAQSGGVKGQPYSAEETFEHVQTLADGTRLTPEPRHTMYYRDSAGRTRTERSFASPPMMINIEDPVAGYRYFLDAANHIARRNKMVGRQPPPPGAVAVMPRPAAIATARRLRPEPSREDLGPQMIEGIMVTGTRMTITYPIGFFGNDRPLTTVTEIWTSPELGRVVQSKTSDPRSGESKLRLTNISRDEPGPSLFQIPADYEIKDPN